MIIRKLVVRKQLPHGEETEELEFYAGDGATLVVTGGVARSGSGDPAGRTTHEIRLDEVAAISISDLRSQPVEVEPAAAAPTAFADGASKEKAGWF